MIKLKTRFVPDTGWRRTGNRTQEKRIQTLWKNLSTSCDTIEVWNAQVGKAQVFKYISSPWKSKPISIEQGAIIHGVLGIDRR